MANPQTENGYVKIASEILDALAKIRIPGEARQVLDFIIRKTYGYHKKADRISTSQMVEGTGLCQRSVERARATLRRMNIITTDKTDGGNSLKIWINKDHETWLPPTKLTFTPDKKRYSPPTKLTDTIDNKDTIQKITTTEQAPDIVNKSVDKPKDNPEIKEAMDKVLDTGFNIYAAIYKAKAQMHQTKDWRFPDPVILRVCAAYHKEREQIKEQWPWFLSVLRRESETWHAEQNVAQGQKFKKEWTSLEEILRKAGSKT